MERAEYVPIKISNIHQEIIDEYNLTQHIFNGWVYFEILQGCYDLPQFGKLENDILRIRLNKSGSYEATTPLGLWRHKWRPILFDLTVDDFGIEYVGERHVQHMLQTLQEHYTITTDWEGNKFSVVELDWKYNTKHSQSKCRFSMKSYIDKVFLKCIHTKPTHPQLTSHNRREKKYGARQ